HQMIVNVAIERAHVFRYQRKLAATHAMQDIHLLARDASQTQHTAFQIHDLREDLIVGPPEREDIVFEFVDTIVEVVEHGRIEIYHLIKDLVQQERRPALARDGRCPQQLLHVVDAAKHVVVIGDDVVWTEKAVELDRVEAIGTGVGSHAMYDEVDVIVKLFDLRVVTILATVFHRQWMEMKDVEQHTFVGCGG